MAFEIKGKTIDTSEYNIDRVEAANGEFQLFCGAIAQILVDVVFTAESADDALNQFLTKLKDYVAVREEFFAKTHDDMTKG